MGKMGNTLIYSTTIIPGNLVLPYENRCAGMMGTQLAIRLAKSGRGVVVFSRDRSKAQIVQHLLLTTRSEWQAHQQK